MECFGLDIGESSIKLAQVKKENDGLSLVNLAEAPSPQPGINGENEKQWVETANVIRALTKDLKLRTKNAVFGLSEQKVISRLIRFPPMKESEVKAALQFEAETFIPYPLTKVQLDYEIVDKDEEGKLLVFIIAALKKTVAKYLKVAKLAGITPIALETAAVALVRIFASNQKPTLIIDLGKRYSNLIIGKQGNVFLTRNIPIGTESLVRAISVSLGLEMNVAEGYRQAYGLKEDELEGKVRKALMPLFQRLADDVKKSIYSFKEDWQENVGLLVFSGGGAATPELAEEMTKILGLEVQVAQPFAGVKVAAPISIDLRKEGPRFSVAFGLASRRLLV